LRSYVRTIVSARNATGDTRRRAVRSATTIERASRRRSFDDCARTGSALQACSACTGHSSQFGVFGSGTVVKAHPHELPVYQVGKLQDGTCVIAIEPRLVFDLSGPGSWRSRDTLT